MSKPFPGLNSSRPIPAPGRLRLVTASRELCSRGGPGGLQIEQIGPAAASWFVHDRIGSTIALLNAVGAVVGQYAYTRYGSTTFTGTVTTPLQYTGQYTDAESGLI